MHSIKAGRPTLASSYPSSDDKSNTLVGVAVLLALVVGGVTALFGGIAAIVFFVIVAFMVFAVSDYRAGIIIAMTLLPLSASQLVPREMFGITGLNPLNATLAMASVSVTFVWLFQRSKMAVPRVPPALALYVLVIAAAALHGSRYVGSIPPFFQLLEVINFNTAGGYLRDVFMKPMLILATAFLLAVLVRNTKNPKRFLLPFFLSAMVLPVFVIGYVATSGASLGMLASTKARDALSVTGMHANELGLMFNMTLALALFSLLGARGFARWALFAAVGILAVAVMLTFSRGAFVGMIGVATYFLLTERRFKVLLGGVLLLPIVFLLLPQAVIDRATTGLENKSVEAISAGRVNNIWRPLAPEVLDSPVVGHGLSSILWSDAVRSGAVLRVGHPHNAYLGLVLDLGFLGAAVVAWFFWRMRGLYASLRARETDPLWKNFFRGATACILLLLLQGITDDRFTPTFAQTYLWLAYGIAIGLAARHGQVTQETVNMQPAPARQA